MRRRLAAALAAVLAAAALLTIPTPARASNTGDLWLINATLRSSQVDQCLDSNEWGAVYKLDCNWGDYQLWTTRAVGQHTEDGHTNLVVQLVDAATQRCLDSNADGWIYTLPCGADNPYQWWIWYTDGHTAYQDFQTGRCLDANTIGGPVYTRPTGLTAGCDSAYQMWGRGMPAQIGPIIPQFPGPQLPTV